MISGTAAVGAAMVDGEVTIADRTGEAACDAGSTLTTSSTGAYRCVLKASVQPPFAVVVVDPMGLVDPMISLATTRPEAGASSTVNISRLTTAIVAQVAPRRDPLAFASGGAVLASLDATAFETVKKNAVRQLALVLQDLGLDAATFDPVSTPFVGGSNAGADALLDQIIVRLENGAPVVANLLAPDVPPVPLADASTTSPPIVPAATIRDSFSITELDFAEQNFEACFAVPSSSRNGHAACSGMVVDDAPAAATGGATYLHNGLTADVAFAALLASADMDGARFNRPELLRFIENGDGRHEALINLKFSDKNGVPDNRVLMLKKFPGSGMATRNSEWWLYGNQRSMNMFVRAAIRQQEQMIPPSEQAAFGAGTSRYQTGLEIYIARPCADTGRLCPNTGNLRYVRVKGPGLPTAGLVFADAGSLPQSWMAILNATGTIPTGEQQQVNNPNNIFWLQRSMGMDGEEAFRIRPNAYVGQAIPGLNFWAHPAMYGQAASATWSFDLSQVPTWSEYTFEIFRGEQTTTDEVYTTRIVTPVVPAAHAATQQWHALTAATKAQAAPGAPATTTLSMEWTNNRYAQRMESVQAYSNLDGVAVNSPSVPVPKGASRQTVTAVGGEFAALSLSNPGQHRFLQQRYKMVDGSYKDTGVTFN